MQMYIPKASEPTIIVDLGCGFDPERYIPCTYRIDLNATREEADQLGITIADFTDPYDLDTILVPDSVDEFHSRHSIRYHISTACDLLTLLDLWGYYLKPGGRITIIDYTEIFDEQSNEPFDEPYHEYRQRFAKTLTDPPRNLELTTEATNNLGYGTYEFIWVFQRLVTDHE